MRVNSVLLMIAFLSFCLCQSAKAQTNDKWLKDYEAMKKFMAEAYANLEWARNGKKINLVALNKKTKEDLKNATSDRESRQILDRFLEIFQDGHLYLRKVKSIPSTTTNKPKIFATDASAKKVCSELGYKFKFHRFSLPFNDAPNFKLISTNKDYFPAGIFTLENGKRFGVLDISLFSADGFLGNCIESWKEFSTNLNKACDGECLDRFYYATNNRLSAKLTEQIKVLQSKKLDYLIVDIGGNGGGSNWVEPATRIISPKTLRANQSGFIRHPHWVTILENRRNVVLEDLAEKHLKKNQIRYLKTAKKRLEKHLKEAKSTCDRSYIWTSNVEQKNCTLLNTTPALTSGVFERLPLIEIANLKSKTILFQPSEFEYEESVFKGNLIVLVDRNTASAAENFASYIQASKSGKIIGEKTYGSGCGYVNGGTKYFLPNSKLQLRMPDCVRYRADGENEVEGVKPDVSLWQMNDNKQNKLEKLLTYFSKL